MTKPENILTQSESVPAIWDSKAVAEYLGLSIAWLERDRMSGEPRIPYFKLGRAVRYRAADVVQALEALKVETVA